MEFKQCPKCGNSDPAYTVLRCTTCKAIVGCYRERDFWGKMFNGEVKGCSIVENHMSDKCPNCRRTGGFLSMTFNMYEITG